MAAPAIAATATTDITSAINPWVLNLPAGITAGDLLLVMVRGTGNNGVVAGPPSGWDSLVQNEGSDASNDPTHVFYRLADGSEGATLSVAISGNNGGAAVALRITGAEAPSTQAPEASTVAVGTGADPDPGSISPTGGSKDYLFVVFAGMDGETQTYTEPSNYGGLLEANSGTAGAVSTNVRVGVASRQLTASSEDPGAFTADAPASGWTAYTIAIHPGAAPSVFIPQVVLI